MILVLTVTCLACSDADDETSGQLDPLMDPAVLKDFLLTASLDTPTLPETYWISSRGEAEDSSWCVRPLRPSTEIVWSTNEGHAAIFFTIFESDEAASFAWRTAKKSLPCDFNTRSVTPFEIGINSSLGGSVQITERLMNGAISGLGPDEPPIGFSAAQALIGNVIVRSTIFAIRAQDGADADAAILLVADAIWFLHKTFCLYGPAGAGPCS